MELAEHQAVGAQDGEALMDDYYSVTLSNGEVVAPCVSKSFAEIIAACWRQDGWAAQIAPAF